VFSDVFVRKSKSITYGIEMLVRREDITKDKLLLRTEKKEDTHHKMLIFNSAQLPKLQSYTVLLQQGSIFWSKTDIYSPPPPLEIDIFSP
jgi:hypothetical protein